MISGIGLSRGQMPAVVGLVVSYVRGRARQLADDARARQRSGVSDEQFWREDEFGFGLERVLDGIEAFVDKRSGV